MSFAIDGAGGNDMFAYCLLQAVWPWVPLWKAPGVAGLNSADPRTSLFAMGASAAGSRR